MKRHLRRRLFRWVFGEITFAPGVRMRTSEEQARLYGEWRRHA